MPNKSQRRAAKDAAAIRFVCAKCGREFVAPERNGLRLEAGGGLGGRTVCEVCAAARFRRVPTLYGIDPDAIQ